ncbi:hypothetical protein [Marisediminicola senii]|uniref:hypothetical protein n=1 Tax=Marisediminicola senii TaxID=2711233 RepID=UPI0013ECEB0E|nr:hypothetical protein [Marisediminicola senii]
MRSAIQLHALRLVVALTTLAVVLAVADQPHAAALLLGGAAAVMIVGAIHYAVLTLVMTERSRGIGGRSREHRQVLARMPAPQHPDTVGRARPRAPGAMIPVA